MLSSYLTLALPNNSFDRSRQPEDFGTCKGAESAELWGNAEGRNGSKNAGSCPALLIGELLATGQCLKRSGEEAGTHEVISEKIATAERM